MTRTTRSKGGGDRKEDVVMGFDEPVTYSVPATLGLGTPLTEAEEAALRVIGRLERAKVDPQTIKWSRDDLNLLLDAARAATRVEADLRARIEAAAKETQASLVVAHAGCIAERCTLRTGDFEFSMGLLRRLAATEAPRRTCEFCGKPLDAGTPFGCGEKECGRRRYERALAAITEDRDEPTMKDRARARMHRATPRPR